MRNYNAHIDRRCIDHGLTRDDERQFTPKPSDFDYVENNHPETDEETEHYSTAGYFSYQSSDSINSDDTSSKTMEPSTLMMEPLSTQATLLNTLGKKPQTTLTPSKC
jgi:hypothetical protein